MTPGVKAGAGAGAGTVAVRLCGIEADIGGFLFDDMYLSFKFLFELYVPSLSIYARVF